MPTQFPVSQRIKALSQFSRLCPTTSNHHLQHHQFPSRHASLTSAISSGVRNAAEALKTAEQRRIREGKLGFWERENKEKVEQVREEDRRRRFREDERREQLQFLAEGVPEGLRQGDKGGVVGTNSQMERAMEPKNIRPDRFDVEGEERRARNARLRRQGVNVDAPLAVPYTTAASEFLYGTFAVQAALRANKRQLYKLYIWCGDGTELQGDDQETKQTVRLANAIKLPVERVGGSWAPLLDRMSDRRPHNGVVLEASSITKLAIKELAAIDEHDRKLQVQLSSNPPEKRAGFTVSKSGLCTFPGLKTAENRFPLLLFLDRITDTGNIGAILRSIYFLGLDGVIVPNHGTAPLNAVTVKASAGAAEFVPIFSVDNEVNFIKASKANGWKFFAAAAEHSAVGSKRGKQEGTDAANILRHNPCVLVLGNEATGLRPYIAKEADHKISVKGARPGDDMVDSLNVSVAAALLASKFLEARVNTQ